MEHLSICCILTFTTFTPIDLPFFCSSQIKPDHIKAGTGMYITAAGLDIELRGRKGAHPQLLIGDVTGRLSTDKRQMRYPFRQLTSSFPPTRLTATIRPSYFAASY